MRIDAREDRCLIVEGTTVAVASVGVQDDTERVRVPVHCHTWKPMGKTVGPCVVGTCSVWIWIRYMDAARRQDCLYFAAKSLLHEKCRVKPRG